jgi:hypothetical protein
MRRIVKRGGLTPWPKLFQNMRATRETELAQRFPIHVVTEWIGNSKAIAVKHYLRVTDADYETAICQVTPNESAAPQSAPKAQRHGQRHAAAVSGSIRQDVRKALEEKGLGDAFPVISHLLAEPSNTPYRSRTD